MKICSKCGSENLIKKGFTADRKQKYKCKDCGYQSLMNKRLSYQAATSGLTEEDQKIISVYAFRFNVSKEDIASYLNQPVEKITKYICFCRQTQEEVKNSSAFKNKEKQLKRWLGIK